MLLGLVSMQVIHKEVFPNSIAYVREYLCLASLFI